MIFEQKNKVREQAMRLSKQKAQQVQRPWGRDVLSLKCFEKAIVWLVSFQPTLTIIWKSMPGVVGLSNISPISGKLEEVLRKAYLRKRVWHNEKDTAQRGGETRASSWMLGDPGQVIYLSGLPFSQA